MFPVRLFPHGLGLLLVGAITACRPAPIPIVTVVPIATQTPTMIPTATRTPTPVPTATDTPTPIPTATKTPTPAPTATKTPTPAPTATNTPTPAPTATKTPTPSTSGAFDLAVQKSVSCNAGTCLFVVTVTNLGPGIYSGPITVVDQTSPPWSTLQGAGASLSFPSFCFMSVDALVCPGPSVNLNPGNSFLFSFNVSFGSSGSSSPFQNCATLESPDSDTNNGNNTACVTVTP